MWQDALAAFYAQNMRASLFTGFLTLSGFLLSAMTFIVVNMKKDVYDHPAYRERVRDMASIGADSSIYAPLRRLSKLLLAAVATSFGASVSQFSIGLCENGWASAICLAIAAVAVVVVASVIYLVGRNVLAWMRSIEEFARKNRETAVPKAPSQDRAG